MSQGALFCPSKSERSPVKIDPRPVAAPFGHRDRSGKFWFERFAADLEEQLTSDEREVLLEILLDWPAKRSDSLRLLLNRWVAAQPLERDNFAESMGR